MPTRCSETGCDGIAVATVRAIRRELVFYVCRLHLGYVAAVVECVDAKICCRHCVAGDHGGCPDGVWCLCPVCVTPR